LHNYPASNAVQKKITNWSTLNSKVFKKIGIQLGRQDIEDLANSVPNVIEHVLYQVLVRFEKPDEEGRLIVNVRRMEKEDSSRPSDHDPFVKIEGSNSPKELSDFEEMIPAFDRNQQQGSEEDMSELLAKIEQTWAQLNKLNDLNKVKEDMVRNLERKL
jgi:hypothetical protein